MTEDPQADDDKLDLSAWQPPAPPDVTEAVLARMAGKAAVELPASRTRYWLGAAAIAAAAAAAVVTIVALRTGEDAAPSDGTVTAARAQHVELAGASADLDAGATLRWHHDRDGLRVEQRGTARWTITDHLHLTAGASSIDTAAANLRVESPMNRQDISIIGTSALTAAAVALVTVVVYEGHVRATTAGQTVTIAAGSTMQLAPTAPDLRDPHDQPAHTMPPVDDIAPLVARCEAAKAQAHWAELEACGNALMAHDHARAQAYLDAARTALAAVPATACTGVKQRAEAALTAGKFATAAQLYERAYACAPETNVLMRTYLAYCKATDAGGAQRTYAKLPRAMQDSASVLQICLNNGIDVRKMPRLVPFSPFDSRTGIDPVRSPATPSAPQPIYTSCQPMGKLVPALADPECGAVVLASTPEAAIAIDGVDTGKRTPLGPFELTPGKHKITFTVGGEKFTFSAIIEAGQTLKWMKTLR